jgi:hypothetical protein
MGLMVEKKTIVIAVVIMAMAIVAFIPMFPKEYTVLEQRQRTEKYIEAEPYTSTSSKTISLIDWSGAVSASKYVYWGIPIDISSKSNNRIYGSIRETAGYDIDFFVTDQVGYNSWKAGQTAPKYVSSGKVSSYSFSFIPSKSDTYYFVLDNAYSWFTNKVPSITATWDYTITTTEYRNVEKTRTVTENVPVTKTKTVSLFQIITNTG